MLGSWFTLVMDSEALCQRAAKLESTNSRNIQFYGSLSSILENMLLDVYANLRPEPGDYEERRLLVHMFNEMVVPVFGNKNGVPSVEAFGSFIMDLFSTTSDLDLSINFSNDTNEIPREKKISILKKFSKVLYAHQKRGTVTGVLPILRARVPVLKVVDCKTRIECDISVENKDGVSRSMFFAVVSSIDERFRILSYLMKAWAKRHDINSSKDKTMNSLMIISLVAFHLQTRNPPILPPFSALLKDGMDVSSIERNALQFKQFGKRNQESIAELFITLFTKLSSIENLWQEGPCASIYEGSWISKTWKSGIGNMSVEDFSDHSENFARSVGTYEMQKINKCLHDSHDHLLQFMEGQFKASYLKELLFGSLGMNTEKNKHRQNGKTNKKRGRALHSTAPDATSAKSVTENATYHMIKRARRDTHGGGQASSYHYSPQMPFGPSVSSFQSQSTSRQASANHHTEMMSFRPLGLLQSQSSSGQASAYRYAPYAPFGQTPTTLIGPSVSSLQSQYGNGLYALRPSAPVQQLPSASNYHPPHPISFHPGHGSGRQQLPLSSQRSNMLLPTGPPPYINHHRYRDPYDHDHMIQGSFYNGRSNFWPR